MKIKNDSFFNLRRKKSVVIRKESGIKKESKRIIRAKSKNCVEAETIEP
jgi:hypothetical protein